VRMNYVHELLAEGDIDDIRDSVVLGILCIETALEHRADFGCSGIK